MEQIQIAQGSRLVTRVSALVKLGDRLLFVSKDKRHWWLPSGILQPQEDLITCVEHSVDKEAGLQVRAGRMFCCFEAYDAPKKIHSIEFIFHSRFKADVPTKTYDEARLVMPYHSYYTIDEISRIETLYPRFLKFGHWQNQAKSSSLAIYKGLYDCLGNRNDEIEREFE